MESLQYGAGGSHDSTHTTTRSGESYLEWCTDRWPNCEINAGRHQTNYTIKSTEYARHTANFIKRVRKQHETAEYIDKNLLILETL